MESILKNFWPVIPALLIDALAFLFTLGTAVVAATPGTSAGGLAGCLVGESFLGEIGCTAGGIALAVIGTAADPFVAPFTIPIGIAAGFAISTCISLTFGAVLVLFMVYNESFYLRSAIVLVLEITPGVSVAPIWTIFAIRCGFLKMREDMLQKTSHVSSGTIVDEETEQQTILQQEGPYRGPMYENTEEAAEPSRPQTTEPRSPLTDIRFTPKAANDNTPQIYAKAA